MGERITPTTLGKLGPRPNDFPVTADTSAPLTGKPRVSELGQTLGHIDDLRSRASLETNWSRARVLRDQSETLMIGLLGRGLSGGLPQGEHIRFDQSDSDPNYSIRITVTTPNQKRTYRLRDRTAKTPAQRDIINRVRAAIRSGGS